MEQALRDDVLVAPDPGRRPGDECPWRARAALRGGHVRLQVAQSGSGIDVAGQIVPGYWEVRGYDADAWVGSPMGEMTPHRLTRRSRRPGRGGQRQQAFALQPGGRWVHRSFALLMGVCLASAALLYLPGLSGLVGQRDIVRLVHVVCGFARPFRCSWGTRPRGASGPTSEGSTASVKSTASGCGRGTRRAGAPGRQVQCRPEAQLSLHPRRHPRDAGDGGDADVPGSLCRQRAHRSRLHPRLVGPRSRCRGRGAHVQGAGRRGCAPRHADGLG